jgi:CRISPR-associated endonuclease Cas1 subtype II
MSWRVVVISNRAKCDYKMGFLVIRQEEERRIHLDDISVLMLESTAVSLTAYLVAEIAARKIKLIFCDNTHNPIAEVVPLQGTYISSGRIRSQVNWGEQIKAAVWQEITKEKIRKQAAILQKVGQDKDFLHLMSFVDQVELGDITNREGHAAKVYFNSLFGKDFYRSGSDMKNSALNYGYTILLSAFNREIVASGYLTQIGIWHDNAENPFNLGSDLMEPFRPVIDLLVHDLQVVNFGKEEKLTIVNLLNTQIRIDNTLQYLNNAIGIYTRSVFNALNENDPQQIINYEL